MTDILLNECGDIDITDGRLTVVGGADAVRQRWLIYIRTFLGEWFLDTTIGVPYFQQVLSKPISRSVLKQIFTKATLEVPGVLQVNSVVIDELDIARRFAEISIACVIDGAEGPETGVFKYTGTFPPEGCDPGDPVPVQVAAADAWYWFDPSDLATLDAPYVPGDWARFDNKFEGQFGQMNSFNSPGISPLILPTLNGRKCFDIDGLADTPLIATGVPVLSTPRNAPIRALRVSTGSPADIPFSHFGVYQSIAQPSLTFDGLLLWNGPDADGVTYRNLSLKIGRDEITDELRIQYQLDKVGSAFDDAEFTATGVDSQAPFVIAATFQESLVTPGDMDLDIWINGVLIGSADVTVGDGKFLSHSGRPAWSLSYNRVADEHEVNFSLRIGEAVGISRHLSPDEVDEINNYLLAKWGI